MSKRPKPDELLEYVRKEERNRKAAKLKIFLGAAPGVGKTYAMLQDALVRKSEGIDVVAGLVETHGRKETEKFLEKIEILPRRTLSYRGKELKEFDLDAALLRKPGLLLVDEMAHANVPGGRHAKRWQDIMEILDRGIDVYTTINVQHIESLNNIVTQITGIVVRETVPDTVFERAHSVEVIDLPPEELIKRLEEGKVYVPTDIGAAIEHFFRKSNLAALRELSLRVTAEQVNADVLLHKRDEAVEKIWPTKDRLLVCIGPEPNVTKLIRTAYRMSKSLHADWIAVAVETPNVKMSDEDYQNIIQHLRLAEQLGGETHIIKGMDLAQDIIDFAHDRNVTKIILGKRTQTRLQQFFGRSLADELVRKITDIDLYILRQEIEEKSSKKIRSSPPEFPKLGYLASILTVAICTVANFFLVPYLELTTLVMVYFLGVIFVSTLGFYGPAILASILSVLAFDLFFVPGSLSFTYSDTQYIVLLATMLLVSQLIARLTFVNKQQAKMARLRELRSTSMHLLTRQLSRHRGSNKLLEISVHYISDVFNSEAIALLPNAKLELVPIVGNMKDLTLSAKDQSVAQWVFDLGQAAGLGTQTLPENEAIYIPLLGTNGPLGVIRVVPKDPNLILVPEQLHLLEGLCNQSAMALEVDRLEEEAKKTELQGEIDHVRNVLLKYISGNMRAPLAHIMGEVNSILTLSAKQHLTTIQQLANKIHYDAEEINHLISNLTQISQLETSEITPTKKLHSLHIVLDAALKSLSRKLGDRLIKKQVPEDLPQILFNKIFIEQVFFNIIENAIKYSPPHTTIEISAIVEEPSKRVVVSVEDEGPGLAIDEINKIFEKFYRGQAITHIKGMGIGLTICQRIITLHGGEIWAENRALGGAAFRFTLPLQ